MLTGQSRMGNTMSAIFFDFHKDRDIIIALFKMKRTPPGGM